MNRALAIIAAARADFIRNQEAPNKMHDAYYGLAVGAFLFFAGAFLT